MNLPEGWTLEINKPQWIFNKFGYYYSESKLITVNPPIWIPRLFWLRKLFTTIITNHETVHAWGIIGCKKLYCLEFEAEMYNIKYKDKWWEKVISFPFQMFYGFRLCKNHRKELKLLINLNRR